MQEFRVLDFDQYFDEFGSRDISEYWGFSKEEEKIEFVSPPRYSEMFGNGVYGYLPLNAKSAYERLIAFKKTPEPKDYSSQAWKERNETEQILFNDIKNICKEVLRPTWGEMKFCYLEVDDNDTSAAGEEFGCYSNEDLMQEKFNYVSNIKPMKFRRIFSNH